MTKLLRNFLLSRQLEIPKILLVIKQKVLTYYKYGMATKSFVQLKAVFGDFI